MLTKNNGKQIKLHMITIDEIVPENHFLRKLEKHIDFSFVYDMVNDLYCSNNGRPSIDPVVLIKYILVGFLYGIDSERKIEQEIQVNMAYRWFLGLDFDDKVPDHSTISQNRRRRFNSTDIFRKMFEHIVRQCIEKKLVDGSVIVTDSSHIKANTSKTTEIRITVEKTPHEYIDLLDKYEEIERSGDTHKAKRGVRKNKKKTQMTEKRISTTDPDAGFLNRSGKPDGMHYLTHQSLDVKNGIITDVHVTPANTRDSAPFLNRIDYQREHLGLDIREIGADSGYDTSLIHKVLHDYGIKFYVPYSVQEQFTKVEFTRDVFTFDIDNDRFICPGNCFLKMTNIERGEFNVLRVYKADKEDCTRCPHRKKCLAPSASERRIRVNIFEDAVRFQKELIGTDRHREILNLRQIWCEGAFAIQKWRHNLKKVWRRGLEAATTHCLFSATALNLKRMVNAMERA